MPNKNDLGKSVTYSTALKMMEMYREAIIAGLNHQQACAVSIRTVEDCSRHSGGNRHVGNRVVPPTRYENYTRIDVSVERFERLLGNLCGVLPILYTNRPEHSILDAFKRGRPGCYWELKQSIRRLLSFVSLNDDDMYEIAAMSEVQDEMDALVSICLQRQASTKMKKWLSIRKGRQLFVPGMGTFDVSLAVSNCLNQGIHRANIETVRGRGYGLYRGGMFYKRIRANDWRRTKPDHVLINRITRKWLVTHWNYWRQNLGTLDEVDFNLVIDDPTVTPQVAKRRQSAVVPEIPLVRVPYTWLQGIPEVALRPEHPECSSILYVLNSTDELDAVGRKGGWCFGRGVYLSNYNESIVNKESVLIVAENREEGRLIAAAEARWYGTKWEIDQLLGPHNGELDENLYHLISARSIKMLQEYVP